MPAAKLTTKKGKRKDKKKKEAVDPAVRSTQAYQRQLDDEYYIPSALRNKTTESHLALIDEVIGSVAAAVDVQQNSEEANADSQSIPASQLKLVIESVGLLPTEAQVTQIERMTVASTAATESDVGTDQGRRIDTRKLRSLLCDLLQTRVLVVDPAKYPMSSEAEKEQRLVSVMYTADEGSVQRCFQSLWKATGSRMSSSAHEASARCIHVKDLKAVFAAKGERAMSNDVLTNEAVESLLYTDASWEDGDIREDAFLLRFVDVR